jgi:hypothetical protein
MVFKVFLRLNLFHSIITSMAAARILETETDYHRFIWSLDTCLADKDYRLMLSFLKHMFLLYKIKISLLREFYA